MGRHKMTPLEIATSYVERGWNPVVIPFKKKRPVGTNWHERRINAANVGRFFNGERQNIGVQLGPVSHDLTDCDLDCSEALVIAPALLPATPAIFGRASARKSHRLYYSDLAETVDKAALQFKDPNRGGDDDKAMLLELRIGGGGRAAQSVFPGSTHPSGESIEWEDGAGDPVEVDGKRARADCTAVGCGMPLCSLLAARRGPP
jgi:hypothetical protein